MRVDRVDRAITCKSRPPRCSRDRVLTDGAWGSEPGGLPRESTNPACRTRKRTGNVLRFFLRVFASWRLCVPSTHGGGHRRNAGSAPERGVRGRGVRAFAGRRSSLDPAAFADSVGNFGKRYSTAAGYPESVKRYGGAAGGVVFTAIRSSPKLHAKTQRRRDAMPKESRSSPRLGAPAPWR